MKEKVKPAQLYDFYSAVNVIATEDIAEGSLVVSCGLLGRHMLIRNASKTVPEDKVNCLWVAKHSMPGCNENKPTTQNYGIVYPWFVVSRGIDTSLSKVGDAVTLSDSGKYVLNTAGRKVGHVLRVGPLSELGDDPASGAVLIKP